MNEFDYERMHENVKIESAKPVNPSSWSSVQSEFTIISGCRATGNFSNTCIEDEAWEGFQEGAQPVSRIEIVGDFPINKSAVESLPIHGLELQMKYRANDGEDIVFMEAYDWTTSLFSTIGFNSTEGSIASLNWTVYALNVAGSWSNYVRPDGVVRIRLFNNVVSDVLTTVYIDFLAVRPVANGTELVVCNEGSVTAHLVAFWMLNLTVHGRTEISVFVNEGERVSYVNGDAEFPVDRCVFKVVTERGNVAIFSLS